MDKTLILIAKLGHWGKSCKNICVCLGGGAPHFAKNLLWAGCLKLCLNFFFLDWLHNIFVLCNWCHNIFLFYFKCGIHFIFILPCGIDCIKNLVKNLQLVSLCVCLFCGV